MAIYAQLDAEGFNNQIATTSGWGEFCRWVDDLGKGYGALAALVEEGDSFAFEALGKQIRKAMQKGEPSPDVRETTDALLVALSHVTDDTLLLTISNGMGLDDDSDDQDDEDGSDDDEDDLPEEEDGPAQKTVSRAAASNDREHLWRKHAKMRVPAEKSFRRVVKKALWNARAQMLAKVAATASRAAAVPVRRDDDKQPDPPRPHPGTALDVMFDPVTFALELGHGIEKVGKLTMQQAGEEVRAELGVDDPWQMEASEVFNALATRANLIQGASADLFAEVEGQIEEGFAVGETTAQIAARIRSTSNEVSRGRAQTIAVTETGYSYSTGRMSGAQSLGAKTKEFLSAHDAHVRPSHQAADGQTVGINDLFKVGSDQMAAPCCGSQAQENCNCRCICLFGA